MDLINGLPIVQELAKNIVYFRYLRPLTDEEHLRYLEAADAGLSPVRHVLIVDTAFASQGTPVQRKRQSEWQERNRRYFADNTICAIFISTSMVVRGGLKAMSWLHIFPYRYTVESTFEGAFKTACAELLREGLSAPDEAGAQRLRAASHFVLPT